ncbi:hypothetical protein FIV42_01010 [Persicimonas caeni]|uniref:HEAT repeat domain-containing protein n=1 Tax=Persicimonas caeni TaxID=2292766 RepID=A0A4Y6PM66_PERCE|nr:hypothetical protein [Persicimonas caeni]QDG49362.1 hypothetical protein FIV42_01010 [Persicimonas caeni]QED30583.1 hypothetical protein FRD00_01005 [Persicimonas caeni]
MSVPSAVKLLEQFDSLCHDERMRVLGLLAQQHADSSEIDRLITELEAGETFESFLAVQLASLTGRVEPLRRALVSGSALVMQSAAKHLARVAGDADTLVNAYERAVPAVRRSLLRRIVRQERTEAAEALFPKVLAEAGPARAMVLLPACGSQTVREALVNYEYAVSNWKSLAMRHPDVVLATLRERLEEASVAQTATVWRRYHRAVGALCLEHAEDIAQLALEYGPAESLPFGFEVIIGVLARRVPQLTFELLTSEKNVPRLQARGLPSSLLGAIRSLSPKHRRKFARILGRSPDHLAELLSAHAPSERAELLEHARSELDAARAPWSQALLEVLPHEARHREARRVLELEDIQSDPIQRLQLSAYLPLEEARCVLEEATRASDAGERAIALGSLVRCAGLNRRGVGEVLEFCQKIENDQDPVRRAVYRALSECPPTVFQDAHAELLFSVIAYAFDARDTSWQTRTPIRDLSVRLLQANATRPQGQIFALALDLIEQLAKQSGYLWVDLEHRLPRGAEEPLIEVLEKPLRDSVEREEYSLLFLFARALGRRAWNSEVIQSLLEKATRAKPDSVAHTAIGLWLEHPKTRDERVVEVLRRDRSAIRLWTVFQHVHRRRQDLLDAYLTKRAILGRFLSGETIYVVPATHGFFRWLPRQQRAYGELLDQLIDDEGNSTWNRTSAMRVRARLLTTRLEDLAPWVASDDVNIAEAALHGTSHLDCPARSCSLLAEHLGSSRARVAMYSMHRAASYAPLAAVHRLLGTILERDRLKVTVEKEAVRLLSRFPSKENVELLFDYVDGRDLHRDVKIAVGLAARNLLHLGRAWDIVEMLAKDGNRYVASSLVWESCASFSTVDARRYLDIILKVARHDDPIAQTSAVTALARWAEVDPHKVAGVGEQHLSDLDSDCWREGLRALERASRHGDVRQHIVGAACTLRTLELDAQPEAEADRDLPARQRLKALTARFGQLGEPWASELRPLLRDLDRELSEDPTLAALRVGLRLAALQLDSVESAHDDLVELLDDLRDTHLTPAELSRRFSSHASTVLSARNESVLRSLTGVMADSQDQRLRRMSVALLSVVGPRFYWPPDTVEVLRQLRRDDDIAVRTAALDLFVAAE